MRCCCSRSSALAFEMSEFWQNLQVRLQPAVPKEIRGARQEVVERLLLDRVEAEPGRPAIGREDDLVVLPGSHEAKAPLPLVQFALSGTTSHARAIIEPVPVAARHGKAHIHGLHVVEMGRF